jgi:hypothetical protein
MLFLCKDNLNVENQLTIGKIYFNCEDYRNNMVLLLDDRSVSAPYYIRRFVVLPDSKLAEELFL